MIDYNNKDDYRKIFGGRTFKAWFGLYHNLYSNRQEYHGADDDDQEDDEVDDDDPNYQRYREYCRDPEFYHYIFDICNQVLDEYHTRLYSLMLIQYPSFQKEQRPAVINHLHNIINTSGGGMLVLIYEALQDQKNRVNLREKYPDLDRWAKFYGQPREPLQLPQTPRCLNPQNTRQWENDRDHEQQEINLHHRWTLQRTSEFKELVRSVLFEHYPEILDFDSEEWILYSVYVHEEYQTFVVACEKVQMLLDFDFPEEYLKFPDDLYMEKVKESTDLLGPTYAADLRNRRVRGERI